MALRDFLADVRDRYDIVLIDCPPNLHLASWASLVASDALIVPLQPEDFGAQGIADVQESIDRVVAGPNPDLKLLGFLITMSNPRLAVHKGFEQLLRSLYGAAVFTTTIPISADFKESIVQRKPVAQYKPRGAAAKVMKALAEEIAARLGMPRANPQTPARRPPDMGKLDDLLKSGGANIAESMGAGLERGDKACPDLDHARPLAGRGQEQERRRGPAGQDRPRPGPAARGIRAGVPRAACRVAQDPGPAPADPGALGRGPEQVRPHLRGTPLAGGQIAGLATMSCVVSEGPLDAGELLALQLVENCLREDLRPIEQARAFKALMDRNGWSGNQAAKTLGIAQPTVVRALALLELPEPVQEQVEQGTLPPATAYEIGKVDDPEIQQESPTAWSRRLEPHRDDRGRPRRGQANAGEAGQGQGAGRARKVPTSRTLKAAGCKITVEHRKGVDDDLLAAALREALDQVEAQRQHAA